MHNNGWTSYYPGPSCSEVSMSLVNLPLKCQMLIPQIFFVEKVWEAFTLQKLLSFFQ